MDTETMNKLAAVINALNTIEVKGKTNLANLSGSIAVLEEIFQRGSDSIKTNEG